MLLVVPVATPPPPKPYRTYASEDPTMAMTTGLDEQWLCDVMAGIC